MTWPAWFNTALANTGPQSWVISARVFDWIPGLGGDWKLATVPMADHDVGLGGESHPPYIPSPPAVAVRTWQTTGGGFSLHVVGDSNMRRALARLAPGSLVGVYAGPRTSSPGAHARIDLGQFIGAQQVSSRASGVLPVWRLNFAPAWSCLRRRPGTNFDNRLFNYAGYDVTISGGAYTSGASTLQLSSVTGIERQAGGYGIVKVTGNSGATFYLRWTGISGTTLTVDTSPYFGTTLENANVGNKVEGIVYLRGHPAEIIRRLLVSTGSADFSAGTAGSNGSHDLYPETWGFGIDRADVDGDGFGRLKSDVMTVDSASGNYLAEILVETAPDNALDWLTSWLRPLGVFLRTYQGKFSAWACQDPWSTSSLFGSFGVTDDLLLPDRLQWQPVTAEGTHNSSQITSDASSYGDDTKTSAYTSAPVFYKRSRDVTGILRSDLSDHAEDVNGRCSPWDTRPLSRLGGQWGSGFYGRLGLGELTRVSTPALGLFTPDQADSGDVLEKTPAMVTAGPVLDLYNGRVWVGLTLIPES